MTLGLLTLPLFEKLQMQRNLVRMNLLTEWLDGKKG